MVRGAVAAGASLSTGRVVRRRAKVRILRTVVAVTLIAAMGYAFRGQLIGLFFRSGPPPADQRGASLEGIGRQAVDVVAERLEVPWEIRFLPDASMLITERPGRLVHLDDGARGSYEVPGVRQIGEGGLMGLALHPSYSENRFIFVCLTAEGEGGLENRVERYRFDPGSDLSGRRVLLDGIPAASFHDGCRLEFGPDDLLYVTTGDAGDSDRAQDRSSLAGKILRLTPDGEVPTENPFGTAIFSFGHRNPQGLAWDERGRLWATEHGRSGLGSGLDELNRIEVGANYGWPVIQGNQTAPDMVTPALNSGPDYTWAPAGAAFHDGRIFFGGLRGESLYEARLHEGRPPELRVHFNGDFGRIRAVRVGPDGMLYFSTSNRDGRGRARSSDDRILRIDPAVLR